MESDLPPARNASLLRHALRLEGRPLVLPPGCPCIPAAMAMFTGNDAVLPFPLRQALNRTDAQLDTLIYQAFPLPHAG
ncbi:MAG: hypothetical protein ACJ746_30655 [Bryobacteraceae bacterium]